MLFFTRQSHFQATNLALGSIITKKPGRILCCQKSLFSYMHSLFCFVCLKTTFSKLLFEYRKKICLVCSCGKLTSEIHRNVNTFEFGEIMGEAFLLLPPWKVESEIKHTLLVVWKVRWKPETESRHAKSTYLQVIYVELQYFIGPKYVRVILQMFNFKWRKLLYVKLT